MAAAIFTARWVRRWSPRRTDPNVCLAHSGADNNQLASICTLLLLLGSSFLLDSFYHHLTAILWLKVSVRGGDACVALGEEGEGTCGNRARATQASPPHVPT